jgi:hypothetical protein
MRRTIAAGVCAVVVACLSAGAAFAGEVKGPPGTPSTPTTDPIPPTSGPTQAPDHSNSACSFSGLNDLIPSQGPTNSIVQNPGHFMLAGITGPGVPGHGDASVGFPIGCKGGSNPRNP